MADDSQTPTNCEKKPKEERQDRRQFFNGLGKWSLAIIAAVSSLAGSITRAQASHREAPPPEPNPQRPAWAVADDGNPHQRMAGYFKQRPHGNYTKNYAVHGDHGHSNYGTIQ